MSTFVGRAAEPETAAVQSPAEAPKQEQKPDKTRAMLIEEAEELGIKVPRNASKAQISKLIENAPVM